VGERNMFQSQKPLAAMTCHNAVNGKDSGISRGDKGQVGNVGSEYEKSDGNCEDIEADTDNRNGKSE
jgi:hypothetical protein